MQWRRSSLFALVILGLVCIAFYVLYSLAVPPPPQPTSRRRGRPNWRARYADVSDTPSSGGLLNETSSQGLSAHTSSSGLETPDADEIPGNTSFTNMKIYRASVARWASKAIKHAEQILIDRAGTMMADAGVPECSPKITSRLEFTHRKARKRELRDIAMASAIRGAAGPQGYIAFAPMLPAVRNTPPILLDSNYTLAARFGKWHVSFATEVADVASPPQLVDAQPEMAVALYRSAVVSLGNAVTCEGVMITSGGCLWDGARRAVVDSTLHDVKNIIAVAFCDAWCRGYYHFSHEHLPRIVLVHHLLLQREDARLVLPQAAETFASQFYRDILGIPQNRILIEDGLRARVVAVPSPQRCGNAYTHLLVGLRELVFRRMAEMPSQAPIVYDAIPTSAATLLATSFASNLGSAHDGFDARNATARQPDTPPDYGLSSSIEQTGERPNVTVLFAERAKLSRMPSNYYDLKAQLMRLFAPRARFITTMGREHMAQQIAKFRAADVVLGPHGANLANIMFMEPGGHVIEMVSWHNGNMCYYTTACRVGLMHHLVFQKEGKDKPYTLTLDILARHLDAAINATTKGK